MARSNPVIWPPTYPREAESILEYTRVGWPREEVLTCMVKKKE